MASQLAVANRVLRLTWFSPCGHRGPPVERIRVPTFFGSLFGGPGNLLKLV